MKNTYSILAGLLLGLCTAMGTVSAQVGQQAVDFVSGGNLSNALEGSDAGTILAGIMHAFLPLANLVGVIILVITGIFLIISQDEGQLATARKTLGVVAAAFVLINVAAPLANSLLTGFGQAGVGGDAAGGASILSAEILGFIDFIEVPIAVVAVIMIIISGIRAIATFGTDQGVANLRRTVFAVIVGIILIVTKIALTTAIGANGLDVFIQGNPDSHPFVQIFRSMLLIVMGFMALAAVIMIIIAGIILVVNKGDEDVFQKARGIIIRTVIGLLVILISGGLVMLVLG